MLKLKTYRAQTPQNLALTKVSGKRAPPALFTLSRGKMAGSSPSYDKSVADPGFPGGGGGANSPEGRTPTYNFAKFSQKLHEIERIWTPGGRPLRTPLDPPLQIISFSGKHFTLED